MPNFVRFMYFLLNSVRDITVNFLWKFLVFKWQTNFVSFMNFHFLLSTTTDKWICYVLKSKKLLKKFSATWKWNARSGRKSNCTFLSLGQEESNNLRSIHKEIRTSLHDKTVQVLNFILPNFRILVSGSTSLISSIIKSLLPKVWRAWKDLCNFCSLQRNITDMKIIFCVFSVLDMPGIWKFSFYWVEN